MQQNAANKAAEKQHNVAKNAAKMQQNVAKHVAKRLHHVAKMQQNVANNVAKRQQNVAENVAKNEDGCVAVFSLEMSSQSLTARMMASMAGISQSNVKSANLTDRQWEKIAKQSAKLKELDNVSPYFWLGVKICLRFKVHK